MSYICTCIIVFHTYIYIYICIYIYIYLYYKYTYRHTDICHHLPIMQREFDFLLNLELAMYEFKLTVPSINAEWRIISSGGKSGDVRRINMSGIVSLCKWRAQRNNFFVFCFCNPDRKLAWSLGSFHIILMEFICCNYWPSGWKLCGRVVCMTCWRCIF